MTSLRIKRWTTFGVVVAGISLALSSAVSASTTNNKPQSCQTLKNGAVVCNVHKVAATDSLGSFHVTSITKITASGDTVLRYQTVNGYATSAKCYKEPSFTDVPKGATCWIATKLGYRFRNSGVNSSGIRVYFEDYIGSKYSPVGTKFYWDEQLRTWRKANCGNYVSFIGTEKLTVAHVELVQTFNQLAVLITGRIQKTLSEEIEAKASCNLPGVSASASIYGSDILRLWIKVQARASSYESAIGQAVASATKKSDKLDAKLSTEVDAQAFDNLRGNVKVYCHSSVTETTITSPSKPKPKPKPKRYFTVSVTKIAEHVQGHQFKYTPTGTFRFKSVVTGYKTNTLTFLYVDQRIGTYLADSRVCVSETKPYGPDKWITLTKSPQCFRLTRNMNIVFKDREQSPPPPKQTTTTTTQPPKQTTTTTTQPPKQTTTTTTQPPATTTTTTTTTTQPPATTTTTTQPPATTTTTTLPPPTTTTTTQPPTPLLIYDLSQPQEVSAGGYTYTFHASVQYPKGDTVSVGFQVYGGANYTVIDSATYGSFPPNGAYYDATAGLWYDVYTSPSQVPPDNNGDVEVVATIKDLTTSQSDSTNIYFQIQSSGTFLIAHNIVHAAA